MIFDGKELPDFGGEAGVRKLVDIFYDLVAKDPILVAIFPPDLTEARQKQYEFFVQFFGGPDLYNQKHGQPFMRFKHRQFKIGKPERDAWMRCFMEALDRFGASPDLRAHLMFRVGRIADVIVNHDPNRKDAEFFN